MSNLIVQEQVEKNLTIYAQLSEGAFSSNTDRACKADTRLFVDWCNSKSISALPATPITVAQYIAHQAELKSLATIKRYVWSIGRMHRAAQLTDCTKHDAVKLALKRMNRDKGTTQTQAAGLTWQHIEHALYALKDDLRGVRDQALVCVAYDLLARRSELVSLKVSDYQIDTDGTATITVDRKKTGKVQILALAKSTVEALNQWLLISGITEGFIFRGVDNAGNVNDQLSVEGVNRTFKRIAKLTGLDATKFSGHSCRVGAAQDMVSYGIELPAIMQCGGWDSTTMPARYSERLQAKRGGMARMAAIQGR